MADGGLLISLISYSTVGRAKGHYVRSYEERSISMGVGWG